VPIRSGARRAKTTVALAQRPAAESDEIPVTFTKDRLRSKLSGRFAIHSFCGWPSGPITAGGATTCQPADAAERAYQRCARSTRATPTTGPAPPVTLTVTWNVSPGRTTAGASSFTVEAASRARIWSANVSRSGSLRLA
jgi:hypothetical protein